MQPGRRLKVVIDDQEFVVNNYMEVYQVGDDETKAEQLVAHYDAKENKLQSGSMEQPVVKPERKTVPVAGATATGIPGQVVRRPQAPVGGITAPANSPTSTNTGDGNKPSTGEPVSGAAAAVANPAGSNKPEDLATNQKTAEERPR